ncbi:Protein kinase domain protein [Legionella cherrii]|uniref:Protein kinase domain protein n=1 Tax=Legionella cherrii TaxID=28084 RepID=A0A0W0S724_9GAMM|nr:protein kinase family protein [Legionella cherrii]KTC79122.1 Protein kinase domain protein [Legionella cherrii]
MANPIHYLNPTLPENIPVVVALMNSVHGANPGLLEAYNVYSLPTSAGEASRYVLTLPVLQFIADPLVRSDAPPRRLDVFEPSSDDKGCFGNVFPVIKSIIPQGEGGYFDESGAYVIKQMRAHHNRLSDKPNKPNMYVRVANREQYLGSQHPTLGIHYNLVKTEQFSYLHMNRAPGRTLDFYIDQLSGEEFLSLACTLIEEVPKQIHRIVSSGKHQGRTMIHCDLKPDNIMAQLNKNEENGHSEWTVTVIDMGLAKTISKDGHYSTLRNHGNRMAWDTNMFLASLHGTLKSYDIQSDIYALFVCISELAGAPSRDGTEITEESTEESIEKLTADEHKKMALERGLEMTQDPDFIGIFGNMGFDPKLAEKLTDTLRGTLHPDKMQRMKPEQALTVFQEALNTVRENAEETLFNTPAKKRKTDQITAEDLKQCIELPLEEMAKEKEQAVEEYNRQPRKITLKKWLNQFNELRSAASPEEYERFKTMLPTVRKNIKGSYISDLLRFNLYEEYDADACIRLILRHEQLTAPLKKDYPTLPGLWQKRFQMLARVIPLQLTQSQALACTQIGLFKQNITALLALESKESDPEIIKVMRQELETQLQLDPKVWYQQLPQFVQLFNHQYDCITQVNALANQLIPHCSWKKDFQQQFIDWTNEIFNQAIQGKFPEIQGYFSHYHSMIALLDRCSQDRETLTGLFNALPDLSQSIIGEESIDIAIRQLKLSDTQTVINLTQKLVLLFLIHDVFYQLIDRDKKEYDSIMQTNSAQFIAIIRQLNQQDPPKGELVIQLGNISDSLKALNQLRFFMDKCSTYPNIQKAIEILLKHNFKIESLANIVNDNYIKVSDAKRLDRGLDIVLSEEANQSLQEFSTRNERIFAEMTRYFAMPGRYFPPEPKIHTQESFAHMLFQPKPQEAKDSDEITALELTPPKNIS